jgi:hypothetical protein
VVAWARRACRVASGGQPRAGFGCDPVAVAARRWYPLEAQGRKETVGLAFTRRPVVWLAQEQRTGAAVAVAVAAWARASPRTYPIDRHGPRGLGLGGVVLARGPEPETARQLAGQSRYVAAAAGQTNLEFGRSGGAGECVRKVGMGRGLSPVGMRWFLFRMGRRFCGRHLCRQLSSWWGPSGRQRGWGLRGAQS